MCSRFMVLGLAARLTHAERGVWLMPNNYPLVDPPDKIAGALSIMQGRGRRANSFLRKLFSGGRHSDPRWVLNEMKWSIMATYTETYKKLRKVRKS